MELAELVEGVREGSKRHLARAISLAERGDPVGRQAAAALHPETGRALRVGITGPPGVGKSSLISALITLLRGRSLRVGVVSVDPSSPFTRGAVLGDRIRLADHFLDEGVFIRSMASRGHLGGLSEGTADAVLMVDAAGYDVVLVETVGAGQNEVEVEALTETVILALMPGVGDGVQAIKAGLMEIPDILVINKADRPGVDLLRAELEATLSLVPSGPWRPPIVATVAVEDTGIAELWDAVERHCIFLGEEGRFAARRRAGIERQLRSLALGRLARQLDALSPELVATLVESVTSREIDPGTAVERLLGSVDLG